MLMELLVLLDLNVIRVVELAMVATLVLLLLALMDISLRKVLVLQLMIRIIQILLLHGLSQLMLVTLVQ